MICFKKTGDILTEDAEALVNTVNCVGVMGRGVALQFKKKFPKNFRAYAEACKRKEVRPGHVFVFETGTLMNPRFIVNFPTKRHWRANSRMEDIEDGLDDLVRVIRKHGIRSVAVPPLGSGLGGLDWREVRPRIEAALRGLDDLDTVVFEPDGAPALEASGFLVRKSGTDGFRIHHQATLKKVVSDRRAALDEETEIRPAARQLVEDEFARAANLPIVRFPEDAAAVPDTPRLSLVVLDPEVEWNPEGEAARNIARWSREKGNSPRLYPASLVWCVKKPGRELRDRVALWLAWRRVSREMADGSLGTEFEQAERNELRTKARDAEEAAREEVWGGYRFAALTDTRAESGIRVIDLGAGHSSANETLCGRIVTALKTEALLSETIGAGYLDRHWPPAFKEAGAWPLTGLRQSFVNGSLTRLIDPDLALRRKLVEFVESGAFGLASGGTADGGYARLWYAEPLAVEEVAFEPSVFLLTKARSEKLRASTNTDPAPGPDVGTEAPPTREVDAEEHIETEGSTSTASVRLRVCGGVPPEQWNRLGRQVIPRLRSGGDLTLKVIFEVETPANGVSSMESDLRRTLDELGLGDQVLIQRL